MHNIVTMFNNIVLENKERVAVISEGKEYTYEELNGCANYIAARINEMARKGDRIGVCVDRSFMMIATILGVLKAGMVYVPMDCNYPYLRLKYMCEEANVKCVICNTGCNFSFANNILCIEGEGICSKENFVEEYTDEAYVIFTSGSSGKPKGVSVSHSSIMNTLLWRIDYYSLTPNDKVLQIPSISYSSSIEDIFSTLLSGGTLVMINQKDLVNVKKMSRDIILYGVTHLLLIPSLYNELLSYLVGSQLRFVVVAGEALSVRIIEKHYMYLKNVRLYNEYGMTETSVAFSVSLIEPFEKGCVIGTPISNMNYRLDNVEDDIGELVIEGIGVASGYLNDEDNHRFSFDNGNRVFFTGDLVKHNEDGKLIYCGRKDRQIKINGKRFDLLEISNILIEELGVEAVAIVNRNNKIVCFVASIDLKRQEIDNILQERIPLDFIPSQYEMVEYIYKLPNGKTDYNALKQIMEGRQ